MPESLVLASPPSKFLNVSVMLDRKDQICNNEEYSSSSTPQNQLEYVSADFEIKIRRKKCSNFVLNSPKDIVSKSKQDQEKLTHGEHPSKCIDALNLTEMHATETFSFDMKHKSFIPIRKNRIKRPCNINFLI